MHEVFMKFVICKLLSVVLSVVILLGFFIAGSYLVVACTSGLEEIGSDDLIDMLSNLSEDGAGLLGSNLSDFKLALPVFD